MGIKGIYGEIGPGERIALSKLAIEKIEQRRRPLRIAIDVSIWQFQTQAGQGGTNPAIRTFYYRLLKLLSFSVQPLFVFDGPHKPKFKRNKKVGHGGAMVSNMMTKQMLKLFGFPSHMAPGEAEAECALLQREGIVDAVLSEDVDTLMFGCGTTLRNWSSEGVRGHKTPTHVSVYNSKATKEGKSGLDREGMVLVALMSGGDYIPEGIPGCGIKVACEAARAGYGKSLCQISKSDDSAYAAWRAGLAHEIQTNESKHFRVRHKALKIPEDFPNKEVLGYYTHPVVSSSSKIETLKKEIDWDGGIDVKGLRAFAGDAFEWTNKGGAIKFIRGLAPVLLVHRLRVRASRRDSGYGDAVLTAIDEMELVRSICGQRTHFSTDGVPELRVVYHPNDIVKLDLDAERDDSEDYGRDGLATVHDDDLVEANVSDDPASRSASPTKRGPSCYDPTQPDKLWVPRTIAKIGIPLKVEDFEASLRNPKKPLKQKDVAKKTTAKGGMPKGALDRFLTVTKSVEKANTGTTKPPAKMSDSASAPILPPARLVPSLGTFTTSIPILPSPEDNPRRSNRTSTQNRTDSTTIKPKQRTAKGREARGRDHLQTASPNANPWSLSNSKPSPQSSNPTITRAFPSQATRKPTQNTVVDILSSRPEAPQSPRNLLISRKQPHSPTPPSSRGSDRGEAGGYLNLPVLRTTAVRTRGGIPAQTNDTIIPHFNVERKDRDKRPPRKWRSSGREEEPLPAGLEDSLDISEPTAPVLGFVSSSHASSASLPSLSNPPSPSASQILKEVIDLSSSPAPAPTAPQHTHTPTSAVLETENGTDPNPQAPVDPARREQRKKFLMLRESIGGFQEVDAEELEAAQEQKKKRGRGKERRAYRYSQVEVLDLRGDE